MSIQLHTVRLPGYQAIEVGHDSTITAPVYLSGALVVPVSAECSVYDDNGGLVTTVAATIVGSIATVVVPGATTAGRMPADGWRLEWLLTLAAGALRARTDAALVRRVLYPVVTDLDLYRVAPALQPGDGAITRRTNYQPFLDEAWQRIEDRLVQAGRRPWLIISPGSLRQCHLLGTLILIFEDLAMQNGTGLAEAAAKYRQDYEAEWGRIVLTYDADNDGQADTRLGAKPAVIWGVGAWGQRRTRWLT